MLIMPLFNKLLSTRSSSKSHSDCRLLVNFGIGANDRSGLYFGADQVRILLFRECEWRGRKLLFDSVSARKANDATLNLSPQNNVKQANGTCTRNGGSLVSEHEKVACDDVSLLSEMVFGTVAMTYRGSLFKVHALNAPRCIMCTKVFPAPDHSARKLSERLTDDTPGHSATIETNSSCGSIRNTISHLSSGNFSANSLSPDLRKNSTCSSTSSGWDIDIPLLGSSQSLESNCSSGFGSTTSLRRRWLRAVSTTLSHSESDEIFGIQAYSENTSSSGNEARENSNRRHKTRLGLAVLIQLTPGHERQMEARLLEHAGQLETMLNRLCYICIERCRSHGKSNGECKGLASRMHRASNRCIVWLLRLLSNVDDNAIPSLWHEVIMNTATPLVHRTHALHRNIQQMCQLINGIDTKSTNFFLSTVLTAVLTHHLGWVQTVMSPHDKKLMENLGKRYPCNPLWAQLGDLYGAIGNPSKLAHTVITGDTEKSTMINAVLTFLSYFIRSAIVEKLRESRCPSQRDVQEAIFVLESLKGKNNVHGRSRKSTNNPRVVMPEVGTSGSRREISLSPSSSSSSSSSTSMIHCESSKSIIFTDKTKNDSFDSRIPRLKRTLSAQKNLDARSASCIEAQLKFSAKIESPDDDETISVDDISLRGSGLMEKNYPISPLKSIVGETTTGPATCENGGTKKRFQRDTSSYNLNDKFYQEDPMESEELTMETKLMSLRERSNESGFNSQKFYPEVRRFETQAFYASLDVTKNMEHSSQVLFTLGDEAKTLEQQTGDESSNDANCQCTFAFTRVPSTSAELPEGVLRKIIQRNFPESSKSIQRPGGFSSRRNDSLVASCPKCNGAGFSVSQSLEGSKLLLETPTNATEVLRTCGNTVGNRATRLLRSNSLEALMEANGVVELPMPSLTKHGIGSWRSHVCRCAGDDILRSRKSQVLNRSKKSSSSAKLPNEATGFTRTLLQRRVTSDAEKTVDSTIYDSGYTSGLVIQGLTKTKMRSEEKNSGTKVPSSNSAASEIGAEWLSQLRDEVDMNARFPVIDQPISEALCILADLDNWQVGVLSNASAVQSPLVPVGMSRLVATMLESFAYLWTKYRSPTHCIEIFECKLREMWLRSEALAEMLLAVDVCDVTIASLTKALDLDAADIPLLLAVATTHSPRIAQRFGLSLA